MMQQELTLPTFMPTQWGHVGICYCENGIYRDNTIKRVMFLKSYDNPVVIEPIIET